MAAKQEINKNTANNLNCSLCTKLLAVLKHKPESENELKCDKCEEDDPVVALCVDCEVCLCQDCCKAHKKQNKTHNITDVPSFGKEGTTVQKVLYCPEHQKNELDYYCETCDKIICLYCTMKDHMGHKHNIVDKAASEHRNMLIKTISPVEEMSKSLTKPKADIVSTLEKIKEQAGKINEEIDKCYVEQLQKLNEHHKQLKKQLDNAVSHKEKALKKQMEEMKSVEDELAKMSKLSENLEKTEDRKVLSTKKEDVEGKMKKVSSEYKALNTQPVEYDTLEFVPAVSPVLKLGDLFISANPHTSEVVNLPSLVYSRQKVDFKIIAKDSKGYLCTKGGGEVSMELRSSSTGDVTLGEVRDYNDGSYMASFVPEQLGEAKLAVSINGQQLKGSPYSIVVHQNYPAIDKPSEIVNNNGSMGKPYGIAVSKSGIWAVGDYIKHLVYLFDGQNKLVKQFGGEGSADGQFNNPRGIAFDSRDNLYIADDNNHRIQKFDVNGNYLLQFGSKGSGDGLLESPHGVAVHNDKVYVTEHSNKRVSVFQTNSQFCFSFGSGQLQYPWDVAVISDNYLAVTDYSNHCLCIFTLDGQYLRKIGTQGTGRGQLNCPRCLAADPNGLLLVTDSHNHRISVYHIQGGFVCSFGLQGSGDAQFNRPTGIALSHNGNLYIMDLGNKRIQIFQVVKNAKFKSKS